MLQLVFCPAFKKKFANQNNKDMIDSMNTSNLCILFIGTPCQKNLIIKILIN